MKRKLFYSFSRNLYERVKESKDNSTKDFPVWHFRLWSFQGRDTKLERFLAKNQLYSNEITKGPGAKNDTSESLGCFNQILTFESRKWSPVATY